MKDFISDAIDRKALLILMIDDFTNIHTKRRPTDHITSKARNMAKILMKWFCDGSTLPVDQNVINPDVKIFVKICCSISPQRCTHLFQQPLHHQCQTG